MCPGASPGSGSTKFWKRFRRLRRRSGRLWCKARSGSTRLRRRFRKRSGILRRRARSESQQGFGKESGEDSRKNWCKAKSSSTEFRRRFWRRFRRRFQEALLQNQIKFIRFREKFPEKVGEALQNQVRFNRVPEKAPEKVWEVLVQSQVRFNKVPEKVPVKFCEAYSTGFRRRFREGLGSFGARARSGSSGFQRRLRKRSGRL